MMPKRGLGRGGRVIAGLAAIVGVAVVGITVVVVIGAVGIPSPGPGPAASPAPVAAVTGAPPTRTGTSSPPAPSSAAPPGPTASTAPPIGSSPAPSAASPSPSVTPAPSPATPQSLLALLDRLRARLSVPGVSVAILWDDGRSWVGASGLRDVAAGVPMTTDTGFALASISKTYTAAVVLELVAEHRLALDQPVARLLPAFRLDPRITVRMLLDHTSGLPDFFMGKGIDAALQGKPDTAWTPMGAWRYVPRLHAVPGSAWSYANTNYLLLGQLVQVVTGHTLAREIRDRLLGPQHLASTWYQVEESPRVALSRGYRLVSRKGGSDQAVAVAPPSDVMPFRSVITAAGGAGSIASTALDTARWMRALATGRVLPAAMQRAMFGDLLRTVMLRASVPYGLGIQEVLLAGHPAIGHAGRYLGYRDVVRYLPDLGLTIAVLTNQGEVDPSRIAAAMVGVVAPRPAPLPTPAPSGSPVPSGSSRPLPTPDASPGY